MSWFSKIFGQDQPKALAHAPQWREPKVIHHTGLISWNESEAHGFVAIVGESFYQETLRGLAELFALIQRDPPVFTAVLVPEVHNPHDPNAVAVMTEGHATIGYLARDMAKTYQKILLKQKPPVTCPARLTGIGKESFGVVLDFEKVRLLR